MGSGSEVNELEPREAEPSVIGNRQSAIVCPFCASRDVELFSLFGSQLLTTEYYCRNCYTVFEQVKR